MLEQVSEEIAYCQARAAECAARACDAADSATRDAFLDMERRWLRLAHSYDFTRRLLQLTNELGSRRDAEAQALAERITGVGPRDGA